MMHRRRWQFWASVIVLSAIVIVGMASVWSLTTNARDQIDKLAVANSDSTQWSLAQLEVEFLVYQNALIAMSAGRGEFAAVKRSFDIFYSRARTVMTSPLYRDIVDLPRAQPAMRRLDEILTSTAQVVDAGDAEISAASADLLQSAAGLRAEIRDISLLGVEVFTTQSELQRANTVQAFIDLQTIAFMLMLVALLVVLFLIRMFWRARKHGEEIAITQNRLQAMISTSIDGILVVDKAGRILDYNGAAEQMFGYSRAEAIGADMAELIVPDEMRDAHSNGMKRYQETGERRVAGAGLLELKAMRKDRKVFPVELSINAAQSAQGEIFVSYLRDISERQANEEELVVARDKAVAGEMAKANLLAVMSHEMRTPLNGVLGTLELLADTELTPQQERFVDVMTSSGELLLEHVNNVLYISRIDAGKAQKAVQAFDLPGLVDGVLESLRGQAAARQNSLHFSQIGHLPALKGGDPTWLRQILVNLIGNAIKFTDHGDIRVEVEQLREGDLVEFRVKDTGIGISDEDIERIFQDFVTLDASYQREVEGTGLGLGITRRLIDLMEGEIGVESEPGEGSVFWFRIPLPDAQAEARKLSNRTAEKVSETSPLSVLVVEDNEINRMVVREMLLKQNCSVTEAQDGSEGVEAAMKSRFDVILMDISMPKMDGTTASAMIKQTPGLNKETPIVALTAHAMPDDIRRFRDAGMVDVVTKPLSNNRLVAVLNDLMGGSIAVSHGSDVRAELVETLGAKQATVLIEKVHSEITEGLDQLREIASAADKEAIAALAHKLAGSAALVGCDEVHALLKDIELENAEMNTEDLNHKSDEIAKLLTKEPEQFV